MTVKAANRRAANRGQHILYATGGEEMSQRRRWRLWTGSYPRSGQET